MPEPFHENPAEDINRGIGLYYNNIILTTVNLPPRIISNEEMIKSDKTFAALIDEFPDRREEIYDHALSILRHLGEINSAIFSSAVKHYFSNGG